MAGGARNRRAGKEWERQLRDGFRSAGHDTEHHRDTGSKDEGDLVVRSKGGHHFVVEAKNAVLNVTDFLRQAREEGDNYLSSRPYIGEDHVMRVVAWKRKGKTFQGGVVMMDMDEFLRLLDKM